MMLQKEITQKCKFSVLLLKARCNQSIQHQSVTEYRVTINGSKIAQNMTDRSVAHTEITCSVIEV